MTFEYQVVRSRRRSLELRVYPDHRVEVRAPLRCPQRDILAFVEERHDWVRKRLAAFPLRPVRTAEERFGQGSVHPYLGESLQLQLQAGRGPARHDADSLTLKVARPHDPQLVERALDGWYRRQAQSLFAERLEQMFPPFAERGHALPSLRLRKMRSRWGSLSRQTGMTLNTELIKTPLSCIDYVVVHELCHLEYMNHGPRFKALMTRMMPDWPTRRRQLNALDWES